MVDAGEVRGDGAIETRRRAKLRAGQPVQVGAQRIGVSAATLD